MQVRRRRVFWLRIPKIVLTLIVLAFGALGLLLSWRQLAPAITASGGKLGYWGQMLQDMLEFACSGV